MNDVDEAKDGRWLSLLTRLLAVAAVFASVGGVSLHLAGYIAQKSYLRAFNVDPDGFIREVDWLMVNGYYSTIPIGSLIAQSFFSKTSLWILGAIFLVVVLVKMLLSREPPAFIRKIRARFANRASGWPRWIASLIDSFFFSGFAWSITYWLALCGFLLLLIPGAIGEKSGNKAASEDASRFAKGCSVSNPCTELWKDDKKIASGFMVATSSDHVAFFDVQLKLVRQLERDGIEVRSPIEPKFSSQVKAAGTPTSSSSGAP